MICDRLNKYRIILASRSPRRQQLLSELGLKFDVVIKDFEETYPENLDGSQIASYIAREKARLFVDEIAGNEIVITADTIVWCNDMILGKPVDNDDAFRMLKAISGNTHKVITGVCILSSHHEKVFSVSTKVFFNAISDEAINYYIENFKPFDKAGAYGIQEWIGLTACSRIEGSYFNVVGLPVQRLFQELQSFID